MASSLFREQLAATSLAQLSLQPAWSLDPGPLDGHGLSWDRLYGTGYASGCSIKKDGSATRACSHTSIRTSGKLEQRHHTCLNA